MDITIRMLNGTSHTLRVQPQDTVGSLKIRIQEKLRVQVQVQKLIFVNGMNTPLNDDSMRLSDYGLHSGATVSLLVSQPPPPPSQPATIQVFLKNDKGVNSTYDISPNETVSNFKSRVQCREGVPVDQQRLIHESRELGQGKLSDYGVKALSTIVLALRLRGG